MKRPVRQTHGHKLRRCARVKQAEAEAEEFGQPDSIISTVSRKAASVKLFRGPETSNQAANRAKKSKPDFWSYYFFVRFYCISAGGFLCEPRGEVETLGFYNDFDTQMLVIRALHHGTSSVTFNHPDMQWLPKTIARAIRAKHEPRVRLVSIDEEGIERFADVEIFMVDQSSLLLMHLRKVSDVVVEFVEKYVIYECLLHVDRD